MSLKLLAAGGPEWFWVFIFNDCPILADKIDRKIYGKHNVKAVVDEYNQCR